MNTRGLRALRCVALAAAAIVTACANTPAQEPPRIDVSASTQALARGTTNMFKTGLVQSGQFRVAERSRLNDSVIRETQLNAAGISSGKPATEVLTGARYIFEGAITEASANETQRSGALRRAGVEFGASTSRDVLGIDVRVVGDATGDIVGAVTVRKDTAIDSTNVSGIGNLFGTALARKGKSNADAPDLQFQQQRKESLDLALRAAIDQSVIELSRRFAL